MDEITQIPLSDWLLGGSGTGDRTTLSSGAEIVRHHAGEWVALYRDVTLAGPPEPSAYLLTADISVSAGNSASVVATVNGSWDSSERNLGAATQETLGVRFYAKGGDCVRAHILVAAHAAATVHAVAIKPMPAKQFHRPTVIPPLLTSRPGHMTAEEWAEFQVEFEKNPIEGNRYLNNLEIQKSVEICHSWPHVLQFSLSSYCNIMCRFCAQTQFDKMFKNPAFVMDDLTVDKLQKMFSDVDVGYPYNVDFSGDGEPIVHPDFVEMLEFCRSKFPFSHLRTCSNGLALTKEMSYKLIEHQLDWLNVSLNAATAESWEITTGNRHFDRVVENLRYLQSLKREMGVTKPIIGMSYVLTRHSLECLPEFVKLCSELGVDSAAVHHMTLNYAEFVPDSVIHIKARANEVLRETRELADRLGVQITLPSLFKDAAPEDDADAPPPVDFDIPARRREYIATFNEAKTREPPQHRTRPPVNLDRPMKETFAATRCRYPWDYFLIKGDGVTRICCGGVPAENGSILESGFWKIWNGDVRQYFRRTVNTARIDEDCYFCPLNTTRDVDESETHMRGTARAQLAAASA